MLVLSEVSSMKPMRGNRLAMNGWRRVIQTWRAWRTSGRFCSRACRSFFVCQSETMERPPDRHAMDRHLVLIGNFQHQIIQREVGLGRHPRRDPVPQTAQLAMPAAISLSARLQPACLAFQDHHVIDELHRNPKPRGRSSVRMPFLHKRDNALPKRHRMWLSHLKPPYLPCGQGITDRWAAAGVGLGFWGSVQRSGLAYYCLVGRSEPR